VNPPEEYGRELHALHHGIERNDKDHQYLKDDAIEISGLQGYP
jgi:hypothetical protein